MTKKEAFEIFKKSGQTLVLLEYNYTEKYRYEECKATIGNWNDFTDFSDFVDSSHSSIKRDGFLLNHFCLGGGLKEMYSGENYFPDDFEIKYDWDKIFEEECLGDKVYFVFIDNNEGFCLEECLGCFSQNIGEEAFLKIFEEIYPEFSCEFFLDSLRIVPMNISE